MSEYPLEKQVIPLEEAKKLVGFLGEHAPESLWVWARNDDGWSVKPKSYRQPESLLGGYVKFINAYNGDELGALLPGTVTIADEMEICKSFELHAFKRNKLDWVYRYENCRCSTDLLNNFPIKNMTSAQFKAALAIQGLTEGWIKKEEFKYEQ